MQNPYELPYLNKPNEKVAIVTGASSGIGYYVTLHLYLHGWKVWMVARSTARLEKARESVLADAKTRMDRLPETASLGSLHTLTVDFSDLTTIQPFVDAFLEQESGLDLLVNNAGIMATPFELTKDGYEVQLQTNHIGPYYLTKLLIPHIQLADSPRIVWVSSVGHYLLFDRMRLGYHFNYFPNVFWSFLRYGNSKAANIHSAKVFAETHPDILSSSVHPGYILDTNILVDYTSAPYTGRCYKAIFKAFSALFGVTPEEGSYAVLFAALSPTLKASHHNGNYYLAYGIEAQPSRIAKDTNKARETAEWTEQQLRDRGHIV